MVDRTPARAPFRIDRAGRAAPVALVALAAAVAALPGVWFPFLSDDWALIRSVIGGIPARTPYEDFRPVFMATLWADHALWGLSPALFHLTNLLLIAAAAALVTLVIRRYTGDDRLALGAGLLFAIHPFHVENAAWIAARTDPLYTLFWLLALVAYDRWRERGIGLPIGALLLYEIALAAKESAVTLPLLVILVGYLDARRRPSAAEWRRGYLPLLALSAIHLIALRTWALGGPGRTLTENLGAESLLHLPGMAAGGILPLHIETLGRRPIVCGAAAIGLAALLLGLARKRSGRLPPVALAAPALFVVLAAPALVGFQERYLFLPAAAAALFLAVLIRSTRGALAATLAGLLAAGFIAGTASRWIAWSEAAIASRALVADLERIADTPGVDEIVVANMPFRVRGGSVAGDFTAALALGGHRAVPVRALAFVSYPDAGVDPLARDAAGHVGGDHPTDDGILRTPAFVELRLRIPREPFWRFVGPRSPVGLEKKRDDLGSVLVEPDGTLRLRVSFSPERGRYACLWRRGRLERLF